MQKLGFGLMRLPLKDANNMTSIDLEQFKQMVDIEIMFTGDITATVADFTIGWPGLLLQVFGTYGLLKLWTK